MIEALPTIKIKRVFGGVCFLTNLFMLLGHEHMKKVHMHNLAYLN